jgi:hypothetical protein
MSVFVMVIASLFAANAFVSGAIQGTTRLYAQKGESRRQAVSVLAREMARYRYKLGSYPASLSALSTQPGFEHTRALIAVPGLGYALAGPISDGTWTYYRAGLAAINLQQYDFASFWNSNTCASGSFSTAQDWCGVNDMATWFKSETRSFYLDNVSRARRRIYRKTLVKFISYFNANAQFPAGTLSTGGYSTLAAQAGYNGSAANCSGVYQFAGIPIDCDDMFTPWGSPVAYNYIGTTYISIAFTTPNIYASGSYQTIAAEMHF